MTERFTDEEGRRILRRAAERQEAAERARLREGETLTLAELESIAEEVGIDRSYVDAAAREVVIRRDAGPVDVSMGLPKELVEVRVLPGTVSDRQWEQMVGVLRESFGRSGIVTQFGDVREWSSSSDGRDGMPVHVRLAPTEGGTQLSMSQSTLSVRQVGPIVGGSFGFIAAFLTAFVAVGDFEPAVWSLPILMLLIAVGSGLGSTLLGKRWVRSRTALMDSVADKMELIGRPEDVAG